VRERAGGWLGPGPAALVVLVGSGTDDVAEGDLTADQCVHDGLDASGHAETALRMLDVVVDGALADPEDPARYPVALALRRQLQALALTPRQPAWHAIASSRVGFPAQGGIHVAGHELHGEIALARHRSRIRHHRA